MNFPTSPNIDDIYTFGDKKWKWNGRGWVSLSSSGGIEVVGSAIVIPVTIDPWVGNEKTIAVPEIENYSHNVNPADQASAQLWGTHGLWFDSPATGQLRVTGASPNVAINILVTIYTGTEPIGGGRWFSGNGVPSDIPESSPGDFYVDLITGTVYQLS